MADSKRLLADALTGLMECKPLDQVRVAEIAAAAGVSKQTFYHHFSDKYHLMEYCFRDMFAAPFERMGTLAPFDECYIEFLQLVPRAQDVSAQRLHLSGREQPVSRDASCAARRVRRPRARIRRARSGGNGVLPGLFLERLRRLHALLVRSGHGFRGRRAGRPHPRVHPRRGRKVFRVAGPPVRVPLSRARVVAGSCCSCVPLPRALAAAQGGTGQRRVHVGILGTQRIAVNASPSPVCASAFALLGARCGSFGLSVVLVAKKARDAQWRHGAFDHPSKVG